MVESASWFAHKKRGYRYEDVSPKKSLAQSQLPVLIIHGEADDFVPPVMATELYNAAAGYKELWLTKSARHVQSFYLYPMAYRARVFAFIHSVSSQNLTPTPDAHKRTYQKNKSKW